MTYSIDPALRQLIRRQFPAAEAAGSFSALHGLTGLTGRVTVGERVLLARRQAQQPIPLVCRQREFRLLKRLAASGLAPAVYGYNQQWLLLEWLPGEVLAPGQLTVQLPALLTLITQLHYQPPTGYPLHILPLLQRYWQLCRQHNPRWLHMLQRLTRQGEPRPLRLAPLHMDIHAGNLVQSGTQLRLIDWEYAGDGDIALELAAIIAANALSIPQSQQLLADYAARNQLDATLLARQVQRWQPWLRLLMASWYQLRAEQTGEECLQQLAAEGWRTL